MQMERGEEEVDVAMGRVGDVAVQMERWRCEDGRRRGGNSIEMVCRKEVMVEMEKEGQMGRREGVGKVGMKSQRG